MIVLPIINKDRVLNVEVKLKSATKIAKNITDFHIGPSDILVNNNKYSESIYSNSITTQESVMSFIRENYKVNKSNILISTKPDVYGSYDIYEVLPPNDKISDGLDNLYGKLLLDLKNENNNQKGRYLDLNKDHVFDIITEDKLNKLEYASQNIQYLNISKYIDENNLRNLFNLFKELDQIDFTIIKKSIISEEQILEISNFLKPTNSKDYNGIANYYNIAKNNQIEYSKLSKLNKIINNKPLELIHNNKEKVKVYSDEHIEEIA